MAWAGFVVDSSGNIYVTDSYNHRVQKLIRPAPMFHSGALWQHCGKVQRPRRHRPGFERQRLVADAGNNRIQKFDSSGNNAGLVRGPMASSRGQFDEPEGVAVDGAEASMWPTQQLSAWKSLIQTATYLNEWGGLYSGIQYFDYPTSVAWIPLAGAMSRDANNNRIQVVETIILWPSSEAWYRRRSVQ